MGFWEGLSSFFSAIAPALIKFMVFALPIALFLGGILRSALEPMSSIFPDDKMYIYIIFAVLIMLIGGIYNYKYPYRKLKKKYTE